MKHTRTVIVAVVLTLAGVGTALAWGFDGHEMVGRVAAEGLPGDMPAFFREDVEQLAYLNPEPDRWRDEALTAMNEAYAYDHYVDLENVPDGALAEPDRFEYLEALYESGLEEPEQSAGFLPYRMLELYERVATGFARWQQTDSEQERRWIEERVINDAGILGHYVADAANPHHTTIHFNGWNSEAANPEGYTTARNFHWQFESEFVAANIVYEDVALAVDGNVEAVDDAWNAIVEYIQTTHEQVVPLYELEKAFGFDPARPAPETEAFTVARLAAGAEMLRTLWYSAWVESEAIAEAWDADEG